MNRRNFLGATAAGLGLAASPAWIRQAFAGELSSKALVFDAYRRARRDGRQLLVFVIPVADLELWPRGHALGAFITYATDAQLAPLAACEVVCATGEHIRDLVPNAPAGEPLAVLIDTTAVPAAVRAISVALVDPFSVADRDYKQSLALADQLVMTNVARIADAFGAVLPPADPKLAAAVRARLSASDVPGSRWARGAGCGVAFEHPDKSDGTGMVDCGMGFVSEKSERFLMLLASRGS